MGLFSWRSVASKNQNIKRTANSLSLMAKLLLWLLPSVVLIVLAEGFMSYRVSYNFIDIALERTVRVQTLAIAHDVNNFLETCKQDLLFVAQGAVNEKELLDFLARKKTFGGITYRELSYISPNEQEHVFLVTNNKKTMRIPENKISAMTPDPFLIFEEAKNLEPKHVLLTRITRAEYPFPSIDSRNHRVTSHIIRFVTPCDPDGDGRYGYLVLAVDIMQVRDILSLYNSPQSPLWGYPRSDQIRFNYLFDPHGWILFQSEDMNREEPPLSTYLTRTNMEGTLGRPNLNCAFRPSTANTPFWEMIKHISEGKPDLQRITNKKSNSKDSSQYYFSYAPVTFDSGDGNNKVFWGVALVDRSKLTTSARYRHMDSLFIITLVAVIGISLLLFIISRMVTRPMLQLSRNVKEFRSTGDIKKIDLNIASYESEMLSKTINEMIDIIHKQREELELQDKIMQAASLTEKADMTNDLIHEEESSGLDILPEIVGYGPKIVQLKSDILKASQANVDVLIIGETGTGKQLAAEAVHRHSNRSDKQFISINCGALDESLLLDTLFGHVKGAFTEARSSRKGAFLEAHGGTLFLDEIQAASSKVQQSLLRAVSMRKIKPLGSDKDIDVDVRLIAATNVNLPELIKEGEFREDLYFRLKVVTVRTPSLKEHPESISTLTMYYLHQAEKMVDKQNLALSKGAMVKLKTYDWPGNIRELINIITRAVVMTEHEVIQASELRLEGEDLIEKTTAITEIHCSPHETEPTKSVSTRSDKAAQPISKYGQEKTESVSSTTDSKASQKSMPHPANPTKGTSSPKLNARQRKAFPEIMRCKKISRQEYQDIVGEDLPSRTAVYDLQDMVRKRLLIKTGKGPSTRYVVVE